MKELVGGSWSGLVPLSGSLRRLNFKFTQVSGVGSWTSREKVKDTG